MFLFYYSSQGKCNQIQHYICECVRAHYIKLKHKKELSFKTIALNTELLIFESKSNKGN